MIYLILTIAIAEAFIIGWLTHIARDLSVLKGKVEQPFLFEDKNGLYRLIMAIKNKDNKGRK